MPMTPPPPPGRSQGWRSNRPGGRSAWSRPRHSRPRSPRRRRRSGRAAPRTRPAPPARVRRPAIVSAHRSPVAVEPVQPAGLPQRLAQRRWRPPSRRSATAGPAAAESEPRRSAAACTVSGTPALSLPSIRMSSGANVNAVIGLRPRVVNSTSRRRSARRRGSKAAKSACRAQAQVRAVVERRAADPTVVEREAAGLDHVEPHPKQAHSRSTRAEIVGPVRLIQGEAAVDGGSAAGLGHRPRKFHVITAILCDQRSLVRPCTRTL